MSSYILKLTLSIVCFPADASFDAPLAFGSLEKGKLYWPADDYKEDPDIARKRFYVANESGVQRVSRKMWYRPDEAIAWRLRSGHIWILYDGHRDYPNSREQEPRIDRFSVEQFKPDASTPKGPAVRPTIRHTTRKRGADYFADLAWNVVLGMECFEPGNLRSSGVDETISWWMHPLRQVLGEHEYVEWGAAVFYDMTPTSEESVQLFVLVGYRLAIWRYEFRKRVTARVGEGEKLEFTGEWSPVGRVWLEWDEPFHAFFDGKDHVFISASGKMVRARIDDVAFMAEAIDVYAGEPPIIAILQDAETGKTHAFTKKEFFPVQAKFEPTPWSPRPVPTAEPERTRQLLLQCAQAVKAKS